MNGKLRVMLGLALLAMVSLARPDGSQPLRPAALSAAATDPTLDTDGDTIPDHLEWVFMSDPTLTDTDGDGRDDFLEIVQHTSVKSATPTQPLDHEMRVTASLAADPMTGVRYVWMHCLFRFASGRLDLNWFSPFVATNQCPVPIGGLIGQTPLNFRLRPCPNEGAFALVSIRLATVHEFARHLPCSVNARAVIGGHFVCSSVYVFDNGGVMSTLLPHGRETQNQTLTVQSLEAHDGSKVPNFASNRKCEQTLVFAGMTAGGPMYEVASSDCIIAEGMRCHSSCPAAVGHSLLLASGLASIMGW
jgi:hypothetical protein